MNASVHIMEDDIAHSIAILDTLAPTVVQGFGFDGTTQH